MEKSIKNFNKFVVGSVFSDIAEMNSITSCAKAKRVSACGKPLFLCSLGFDACRSSGERVRFRCISDGYRITWLCDKLVGFSNLGDGL